MNPYEPPPVNVPVTRTHSQFVAGAKRSMFALVVSLFTCAAIVLIAKAIDWLIPGKGALHDKSILHLIPYGMVSIVLAYSGMLKAKALGTADGRKI